MLHVLRSVVLTSVAFAALGCAAFADESSATNVNSVTLDGRAFAGAVGLLRINQSAGLANTQANVTLIAVGTVSDARLDSVATGTTAPLARYAPNRDRITFGRGAFVGASGIVQINQSAGDGNTSRNTFALTVRP